MDEAGAEDDVRKVVVLVRKVADGQEHSFEVAGVAAFDLLY